MPKPRKTQVTLDATPYYPCVSRCVRRAFLCGKDIFSDRRYEHRLYFIEDKLLPLTNIFAIDLCAYSVMSNHYHAVVHVDSALALGWTDLEVIQRWHQLFNSTPLTRRFAKGEILSNTEQEAVLEKTYLWRQLS